MTFRNFRIQVFVRLIVIVSLGFATFYVIRETHFWLVSIWTGLLGIIFFAELIRYIERNHRELHYFVSAIEQNDFSNTYVSPNPEKQPLKQVYGRIMNTFRELRSEKESQHQFLQTVVEHVGQALLCYDDDEQILLLNRAAQDLFQKPYLRSLESLEKIDPKLLELTANIPTGSQELYKFNRNGELAYLSIQATEFKLRDKPHKLISFRDISREMEAQEVESWQKLIRVLTHEITNSVIPISTLSKLSEEMLHNTDGSPRDLSELDEEDVEDLRGSLKTIAGRSQGLVNFVRSYRSMTQLSPQTLNMATVEVSQLFERVSTLLTHRLQLRNIHIETVLPEESLHIEADFDRIEQILINLVLNAADAVEGGDQPKIVLKAEAEKFGKILLKVRDNGPGIDSTLIDKIFIPFFTTKEKGSGIGLSLARQIMRMHKGSISVKSQAGEGAVFTLSF